MGDYTACELKIAAGLDAVTLARVAAAFSAWTDGNDVLEDLREDSHTAGLDFRVGAEVEFADELRGIADVPFTFWTSPKHEHLGLMVKYTPRLSGYFVADCTDDGDVVVSNTDLLACVRGATSTAEVRSWVEAHLGCAWDVVSNPPTSTSAGLTR